MKLRNLSFAAGILSLALSSLSIPAHAGEWYYDNISVTQQRTSVTIGASTNSTSTSHFDFATGSALGGGVVDAATDAIPNGGPDYIGYIVYALADMDGQSFTWHPDFPGDIPDMTDPYRVYIYGTVDNSIFNCDGTLSNLNAPFYQNTYVSKGHHLHGFFKDEITPTLTYDSDGNEVYTLLVPEHVMTGRIEGSSDPFLTGFGSAETRITYTIYPVVNPGDQAPTMPVG